MVDQQQRLDGEYGCDVAVVDRQQIVAVCRLATGRQIRRAAENHGIVAVEPADDELVVNLVPDAADVRHLVERRRQYGVHRLAGDEHARLLANRKQSNTAGVVGNPIAENILVCMKVLQCLVNRTFAFRHFHHGKQYAANAVALALLPFLGKCDRPIPEVLARRGPRRAARR